MEKQTVQMRVGKEERDYLKSKRVHPRQPLHEVLKKIIAGMELRK